MRYQLRFVFEFELLLGASQLRPHVLQVREVCPHGLELSCEPPHLMRAVSASSTSGYGIVLDDEGDIVMHEGGADGRGGQGLGHSDLASKGMGLDMGAARRSASAPV